MTHKWRPISEFQGEMFILGTRDFSPDSTEVYKYKGQDLSQRITHYLPLHEVMPKEELPK